MKKVLVFNVEAEGHEIGEVIKNYGTVTVAQLKYYLQFFDENMEIVIGLNNSDLPTFGTLDEYTTTIFAEDENGKYVQVKDEEC